MVISAAASIENQKQRLNELNVFPVPDGDTGTNMAMTMGAATADLRKLDNPTLTKVADATASALLRGARGNSGVILSLLFRGFAKGLKGKTEADGTDLAIALNAGVEAAYKAVMKPAEGTILTVSRLSAASATLDAEHKKAIEYVLTQTIESAKKALAETQFQNPVLEKAGVVDAGGMGYLMILEGMLSSLQGADVEISTTTAETNDQANFSDFSTEDITFGYCTEFIINRENDLDPMDLRDYLDTMGDSLVLVDDDEIIKVHVHTDAPGTAIEKAMTYGGLVTVKIENMRLQHTEKVMQEKDLAPKVAPAEKKYGIVSVCAGSGIASAFRDLGVDGIIEGGQTMNPSTEDILNEVNKTPSEIVFVFPNNKNIIMAAEQTIPLCEKQVVVIPSKTIPQGITALLSFDPEGELDDMVAAMTESMDMVTTMQITYAARNSDFDGQEIKEGDYLALMGNALFGTDKKIDNLLTQLAESVAKEGKEFITIFYGADIDEKQAKKALKIFEKKCPGAEITLLQGNQPIYYYLIAAE
ncbi:MAG: DAK2 domain-containing protein [Eubacteriales bacterium]